MSGHRTWGEYFQKSIEWECTVPKLGNVYPGASFADMSVDTFFDAARSIGEQIDQLPPAELRSVGDVVHRSVMAMMQCPGINTSLGTILLLAPLLVAGEINGLLTDRESAKADTTNRLQQRMESLRVEVGRVLEELTPSDSSKIYAAIAKASPGGIGKSDEMDVAGRPPDRLLDAMQYASSYDDVALQYVSRFDLVFDSARRLLWTPTPQPEMVHPIEPQWKVAIQDMQLNILSSRLDSLILRKSGKGLANEVMQRANEVRSTLNHSSSSSFEEHWTTMDHWMRSHRTADGKQLLNPGTTADLIAAAIFVRLIIEI